mmetsp:Transcript_4038/g.7759  ORF Transcript_4038/g.7759 Transcript_4038/m.7759 type:complete len:81 (-) Transcript_4038:513-755(-)
MFPPRLEDRSFPVSRKYGSPVNNPRPRGPKYILFDHRKGDSSDSGGNKPSGKVPSITAPTTISLKELFSDPCRFNLSRKC